MSAWERSDDYELRHIYLGVAGMTVMAEGRPEEAVDLLETSAREAVERFGASADGGRISWGDAVDAALALGQVERVERLVARLPPNREVGSRRCYGASWRGGRRCLPRLVTSTMRSRRASGPRSQHSPSSASPSPTPGRRRTWASWLIERGCSEDAAPVLEEAKTTLEGLRAEPLLRRVRDLSAARAGSPR